MILAVADDDVAGGGDGDALEAFELAVAAAPAAVRLEEGTVRTEDLYAIVAGIGDDDVTLIVHGNAPRELELPVVRALRAEGRQHAAVDVEYLNAVIVTVADDHSIGIAHRDVMRVLQLAASAAARAEFAHERAVRLKYLPTRHSGQRYYYIQRKIQTKIFGDVLLDLLLLYFKIVRSVSFSFL